MVCNKLSVISLAIAFTTMHYVHCASSDPDVDGWCKYSGMFIYSYDSTSTYIFTKLSEAKKNCIRQQSTCAGITQEGSNRYTLRKGTVLHDSPSGENTWLYCNPIADLGVNNNLAVNSTTETALQDQDVTTCHNLTASKSLVFDLTKNVDCGGVCRVNYVLIYGENLAISTTIKVKIDNSDCNSTSSDKTICAPNLLGSTVTLNYTHTSSSSVVKLCEVIIAGVKSADYNCTDGYTKSNNYCTACSGGQYKDNSMTTCDNCPANTYSASAAESCTNCDLMSYAPTKSTGCTKCSTLSKERECYGFKGRTNVLQGSDDLSDTVIAELKSLSSTKCHDIKRNITRFTLVNSSALDTVVAVYKPNSKLITMRVGDVNCTQTNSWDSHYGMQIVFDCTVKNPMEGHKYIEMRSDGQQYQICNLFVFGIEFSQVPASPGYYNNGSNILMCTAGKYSKGGNVTACTPCPINQYQDETGQDSCKNCASGFYTSEQQQTSCRECSPDSSELVGCIATSCAGVEQTSIVYGTYVWSVARIGHTLEQPCTYNNDKNATKECSSSGTFLETNFQECKSAVSKELVIIKNEFINNVTQVDISEALDEAVKNSTILSADDIGTTSDILKNLVTNTSVIDDKTTVNMLSVVSSISKNGNKDEFRTEKGMNNAKKMVSVVNDLAAKLTRQNTSDSIIVSESVAVVIPKDNTISLSGTNMTLKGAVNEDNEHTFFSAKISSTIIDGMAERLTGVFFEGDKLFPVNSSSQKIISNTETDFKSEIENWADAVFKTNITTNKENQEPVDNSKVELVASLISAIGFAEQTERVNLTEKLNLTYLVEDVQIETYRKFRLKKEVWCKFYDTNKGEWDIEGCTTTVVWEGGLYKVYCTCDHMTSFAVLMSFSSDYNIYEEYVTQILLAASLVCLLSTIVAYLPAKKMLAQRSVRINLLLTASLVCAIITFFFMDVVVDTKSSVNANATAGCITVGFLMNYFWLSQMAWMVLEAVVMYMVLVRVFGSHISRYMLKFNILAWGIPVLFPIIGLAWGGRNYIDPTTCFIRKPYAYVTFYVPVIVCVIFNIVIFVMVARVIFRSKSAGQVSEQMQRKRQFKSALAVMVLLGAGWIFGFLLIIENVNNDFLRWLFIIINCSQGIFIFIFYVICNAELKKSWLEILGIKKPTSKTASSTGAAYKSKPGKTASTGLSAPTSSSTRKVNSTICHNDTSTHEKHGYTNIATDIEHIYDTPDKCKSIEMRVMNKI